MGKYLEDRELNTVLENYFESLNEGSNWISTQDKNNFENYLNKTYKPILNKYIKDHKNDKQFQIVLGDDYIEYMPPVNSIKVLFNSVMNQLYILVKGSYYDYQEAYNLITKLLLDYILKDKELKNKYLFKYNEDYNVIFVDSKDKNIINSINNSKKEFDKIMSKINLLNLDNYKINGNEIRNEIKRNTILNSAQKQKLQRELYIKIETLKAIEEELPNVSEESKQLMKILDEVGSRCTKAGYRSCQKFWYTDYPVYPESYFHFSIYDSNYSGTGGDYDNGVTDKNENVKFINTLRKIYKNMEKEYNCKFSEDVYRGHGTLSVKI